MYEYFVRGKSEWSGVFLAGESGAKLERIRGVILDPCVAADWLDGSGGVKTFAKKKY